jgi:hypothetical protein
MSFLVQYGSLRKFDIQPIPPILSQLFLKAALLLVPNAACDYDTAKRMIDGMALMHYVSAENADAVNNSVWVRELGALADNDDKHPCLCGYAASLLLERGMLSFDELGVYVSRYLSAGNTPENGAYWFEGLSSRNRYILLSHQEFWKDLDQYLSGLDDDAFKSTLVLLRRAFSVFEPREKTGICEILAEIWGAESSGIEELLLNELNEEEQGAFDELNDFDFGDLL